MENLESLTTFLGWCSIINIAMLMTASAALVFMRKWVTGIHSRMFDLEAEDLSRAYFQYLAQYKIAVLIFSVVPYAALKIMG